MIELTVRAEVWPVRGVFRISRGSRTEITVILVELRKGETVGRGECVPCGRYGESVASTIAAVESIRESMKEGMTRQELQTALPAGAARNAVDCALWDLEAKLTGSSVWRLVGLESPPPAVLTAVTISVDTPEAMAAAAVNYGQAPLLKIKLGGEGDVERVKTVRHAAPSARLIVDANEAWTSSHCREYMPRLAELGVEMIEQPMPAAEDEGLRGIDRSVPLCADESCHTSSDLARLSGLYEYVNIKLDKTGGLTAALALVKEAKKVGFGIMVGGMVGTSLAMAPAVLLTPWAEFVDLDGPILLEKDRESPLLYEEGKVFPAAPALWG